MIRVMSVMTSPRTLPSWQALALWAGPPVVATGLFLHGTWSALPLRASADLVFIAVFLALLAWPLKKLWSCPWPGALAMVGLAALIGFWGPLPVLATALLVAAAIGLGSLLIPGPLALPIGLALWAGTVSWSLPSGIHHRPVHMALLLAVVVLRRSAIVAVLQGMASHWRSATTAAPWAATAAMAVGLMVSTGTWLPTLQYDDLAYHLGLPWQLQQTGRYALDPSHQVWALAPWAGDVLHALTQSVAGTETRGPVNAVWLTILGGAAYRIADILGDRPWQPWAAAALALSTPLTLTLAGNMQTELPAAATMAAFACCVMDRTRGPRTAVAAATLAGLLIGLKLMHAAVALPLLLWWWWAWRGTRLGVATKMASAGLALVVGSSSYLYAWHVTGNPVLPLANAFFRSPFFPAVNFDDPRWHRGLEFDTLWQMTFDTERYVEGWDGAFGFTCVVLAGAWILALLKPGTRGPAIAATVGLLIALVPIQYARYAYPAVSLLAPVLIAAIPRATGAGPVVALACVLNVAFAPNAHWIIRDGAVRHAMVALGRDEPLFERYAPERLLAMEIRTRVPDGQPVLALNTDPGALAELGRRARTVSWYSPAMHGAAQLAERDRSGATWARLLRENGIRHVILRPATLSAAQRLALEMVGAHPVKTVAAAEWWRLEPTERR